MFFIDICDFSWYKIKSQDELDILLNENRIDDTLQFGYYENTYTVEIENQRQIKKQYNLNISDTGKLIIGKLSEFIGILTVNCCTAI